MNQNNYCDFCDTFMLKLKIGDTTTKYSVCFECLQGHVESVFVKEKDVDKEGKTVNKVTHWATKCCHCQTDPEEGVTL